MVALSGHCHPGALLSATGYLMFFDGNDGWSFLPLLCKSSHTSLCIEMMEMTVMVALGTWMGPTHTIIVPLHHHS